MVIKMTTGYQVAIVAEARQRLQDLLKGIDGIRKLQDDARNAQQYKQDPSGLYVAARQNLLALATDFDIFKVFITDNKSKLYNNESKYYEYIKDSIQRQIDFLEDTIVTPTINAPLPTGSENETDVGRSFVGVIKQVTDGDTFIISQIVNPDDDGGLIHDRIVRIAGIDTPEGGTERGKFITNATSDFWLGKTVTVYYDRHTPNDLYGRVLGTVYFNDTNFAIWSISHCYSTPNLKFEKNHFVDPVELKQAAKDCIMSYPSIGILKIFTKPPHADIYIGKSGDEPKKHGDVTPCEIELPAGQYVIILSSPGYSSLREEIEIVANKKDQMARSLIKSPVDSGIVRVFTNPIDSGAIVSVDDKITGLSPLTLELPVDVPVKISVSAERFKTQEDSVVPVIGGPTYVTFVLESI
jgi:endonuclease YncB( thermonuclease family)